MLDYNESVNYIHSFLKFGVKLGLDRMEKLLSALGKTLAVVPLKTANDV